MLDLAEIAAAVSFFWMGSGFVHLRALIALYVGLSAFIGFVSTYFGVIDDIGANIYYLNLALSTGLCLLSTLRPNKHTFSSGIPFILTSILCLCSYVGYHLGEVIFYNIYPEAMMILTAWQLVLLLRIGNVGENIKHGMADIVANSVGGGGDFSNRHDFIRAGVHAREHFRWQ